MGEGQRLRDSFATGVQNPGRRFILVFMEPNLQSQLRNAVRQVVSQTKGTLPDRPGELEWRRIFSAMGLRGETLKLSLDDCKWATECWEEFVQDEG